MSGSFDMDLHPDRVSNLEMGYVYEELVRRFSELSNETAGEHFTPREVIHLMVNLLIAPDRDTISPLCSPTWASSVAAPEIQIRSSTGGRPGPMPCTRRDTTCHSR